MFRYNSEGFSLQAIEMFIKSQVNCETEIFNGSCSFKFAFLQFGGSIL